MKYEIAYVDALEHLVLNPGVLPCMSRKMLAINYAFKCEMKRATRQLLSTRVREGQLGGDYKTWWSGSGIASEEYMHVQVGRE